MYLILYTANTVYTHQTAKGWEKRSITTTILKLRIWRLLILSSLRSHSKSVEWLKA